MYFPSEWRGAVVAAVGAVALSAAFCAAGSVKAAAQPTPWSFAGADGSDTRAMYTPKGANQLSPANVKRLSVKWTFHTAGSITETPAVEQGGLYVTDLNGYVYKINPDTGAQIWSHKLSYYTGDTRSYALSSPAISGSSIVVGDRAGARIIAINKYSGEKLWETLVDPNVHGLITGGVTIYNGVVYSGVASNEESYAVNSTYVPTFRGSVVALNLSNGAIRWKVQTVPYGYAGGAVWGGSVVVSPALGLLFAGTGNNYGVPKGVSSCLASAGSNKSAQIACLDPTDYVDSIVAINFNTGRLAWSRRFEGGDTWTVGCLRSGLPGCPSPRGRDADFSAAPNLIGIPSFNWVPDDRGGSSRGWVLSAGEKGGMLWGINPVNGGLFWSRSLGDGDVLWGTAVGNIWTDMYIFAPINTQTGVNHLIGQVGGGSMTWQAGYWSAVEATTGKLVWQVPASRTDLMNHALGATAKGPVSFSNGLVFAGDTGGNLIVIDARTGFKWWQYYTGVTVASSPAIFNNVVYWGVGGDSHGIVGHTLYAFAVPD